MLADLCHIHNQFHYILSSDPRKMPYNYAHHLYEQHMLEQQLHFHHFPKSKIHTCKSYNLDTHSCHHLSRNSPTIMCGDATTQSSVVNIINLRLTVV